MGVPHVQRRTQGPTIYLAITNGINKTAAALAGLFWFSYSLAHFDSPLVYNRTLRVIAIIPVVLVPILYVIGFMTNTNFAVQDDGTTVNGALYIATTAVGAIYLAAATAASLWRFTKAQSTAQRRTCLVFVAFMAAPVISIIFDSFVPNMPVMAPAMLVSIVLVLLSLQESRISNDALTGLNNRRRADAYLEESMANVSSQQPLYLFIIDMNRFKAINDTYGHLEGDHALQLAAEALRQACSSLDAFAARWGGDEFVVICTHDIHDDPDRVENEIKTCLSDVASRAKVAYDLSCSVGYARCDSPNEPMSDFVSRADQALYASKRSSR